MNTPPQNGQGQPGMQMPQMNNAAPRIKPEPGMDSPPGMSQPPNYSHPALTMPNATTAQQRAAQHLQNNYGQRAAASINAIQGSAQQPPGASQQMHQMQQQQHLAMQQHQSQIMQQQQRAQQPPGQRPQVTPEEYKRYMAQQTAKQLQQQNGQNGQNGFNPSQTDGAGDEMEDTSTLVKQIGPNGEETIGRVEIDGLIRDKIAAMGSQMEGGGLMLPLSELKKSKPSKRQRKVKTGFQQHDGGDSDDEDKDGVKDEELDEDAINSDLDDPDDGLNDEEDEDEGMGHIMLCMYDKVQRVKNKWYVLLFPFPRFPTSHFPIPPSTFCRRLRKNSSTDKQNRKCVMKDGVLTVNGKEYVFHKAQGEYEW
jgi:transcription initiation factor TFIIA large subunit